MRDLHNLSLKTRSNFYLETNILAFTFQNFVDSLSREKPKILLFKQKLTI